MARAIAVCLLLLGPMRVLGSPLETCVETATVALPTYDLAIEGACAAKMQRDACLDALLALEDAPVSPPEARVPWWVWPLVGVAFGGGVAVGVAASQ